MAASIQNKRNQQIYLRQVQQEKAQIKRDIAQAQKADMKSVRDHYANQAKQIDTDSAAAVSHIKEESRQLAQAEQHERSEQRTAEAEQKKIDRQERSAARSGGDTQSYAKTEGGSVEKKNLYSNPAQHKTPVVQNYETKESDDFYRVQNRGSRLSEGSGFYTIDAYAPEHEKDNLRVSIQRNKAVISGQRKFSDEADDELKKMSTNNYQSFREEFQFDRPVSGQGMTRERIGDFVRFTIAKLEAIDGADENS